MYDIYSAIVKRWNAFVPLKSVFGELRLRRPAKKSDLPWAFYLPLGTSPSFHTSESRTSVESVQFSMFFEGDVIWRTYYEAFSSQDAFGPKAIIYLPGTHGLFLCCREMSHSYQPEDDVGYHGVGQLQVDVDFTIQSQYGRRP